MKNNNCFFFSVIVDQNIYDQCQRKQDLGMSYIYKCSHFHKRGYDLYAMALHFSSNVQMQL